MEVTADEAAKALPHVEQKAAEFMAALDADEIHVFRLGDEFQISPVEMLRTDDGSVASITLREFRRIAMNR